MGVLSSVGHIVNETAMHAGAQASNRLATGKQSKSWSKSEGKGISKEYNGNPKENPKEPKEPKVRTRVKHRKLVYQVLKTRKQRQARKLRNLHRRVPPTILGCMMAGVMMNGTMAGVFISGVMIGVLLDGTKVTYDTSASTSSLGGLDVSATVVLTGVVHKVLCSAAEIACKGRQYFHLGHDGGYMTPIHSKICQGTRTHLEKLVNWHGKNELIPVYLENNIVNFYMNREVQSTETNHVNDVDHYFAKNCERPTKTLNRDVAPIGDDIEPVGESCADVEMGNEED